MFKVLGITDEKTECEKCGKSGLKKTIVLEAEDGSIVYYGSDCAGASLYGRKSAKNARIVTTDAQVAALAHKLLDKGFTPWKVSQAISARYGYGADTFGGKLKLILGGVEVTFN